MKKVPFYFIACVLILLQLEQLNSQVLTSIQNAICIFLILTLGISHGAVDHLLYNAQEKVRLSKFVIFYLIAAFVNTMIWFVSLDLALLLFLCISAYHFGQSQFIEYSFRRNLYSNILYFSWGAWIIVGLVLFNQTEIEIAINQQFITMAILNHIMYYGLHYFIFFGLITVCLFTLKFARLQLSFHGLLLEIVQLALIFIAFSLFSTLLGFTLYFIILHSFRVLNQEFHYLWKTLNLKNLFQFIRLLMPFTMLALFGLVVILLTWMYFDLNISLPLLALILISNITLPHSYVMDGFYHSRFRNLSKIE